MKETRGMTLIELMIVVAMFALLLTFLLPSLTAVRQSSGAFSVSSELMNSFQVVRSEASSRGTQVRMGGIGGNWSNGWRIWIERGNNNSFNGNDELLVEKVMNRNGLRVTNNPAQATVVFGSGGHLLSLPAANNVMVFQVCEGGFGKRITVRRSGQLVESNVNCPGGA